MEGEMRRRSNTLKRRFRVEDGEYRILEIRVYVEMWKSRGK